jgi:DNA polymerase-3 subunit delta'
MILWHDLHAAPWSLLQRARQDDRLPHALLMAGPAGIGKLAFAEDLAASLLCDTPQTGGQACGSCTACTWHASGNHPDFRRIRPEAYEDESVVEEEGRSTAKTERKKSEQIRIDQVRSLESFIQVGSHRGRRVILIEPAEAMNEATANALLKSLEEPPPGVHFLLVSHAAERLLPTVRSRTRAIPMRVPESAVALGQLKSVGISPQDGALWLNRCAGALRFALALARAAKKDPAASEEATAEVAILEALLAQLPAGERMDALALGRTCETLIKGDQSGLRLAQLIDWLQRWTMDLQLVRLGSTPRAFPEMQPTLEKLVAHIDDEALAKFPEALLEARRLSAHPLNIRLFLESLFSRTIGLYEART